MHGSTLLNTDADGVGAAGARAVRARSSRASATVLKTPRTSVSPLPLRPGTGRAPLGRRFAVPFLFVFIRVDPWFNLCVRVQPARQAPMLSR